MNDGIDLIGRYTGLDHPTGNVQHLPCDPSGGSHLEDLLGSLLLNDPRKHLRAILGHAVVGVVWLHNVGFGDDPLRTLHAGHDRAGILKGRVDQILQGGDCRGGAESLAARAS